MKRHALLSVGLAALLLALALVGSGCMTPQMTYQGRLTDENGKVLNGTYTMTFSIYDDGTSGNQIYSQSEAVDVEDGLFDAVVGPSSGVSGVAPEELAQPLWLEVRVSDGSVTETLDPRQRLYGAPYAFTLLPGAVISEAMDSTVFGAGGAKAVLNVVNSHEGTSGNPPLPALRVVGNLELSDGAIQVDGAGVGTETPVFVHEATAGNISGHMTEIDHPLTNGDPDAILIVTQNWSVNDVYNDQSIGVYYESFTNKWRIFNQNTTEAMPVGAAFNVLVVKP